MDAVRQQNQRDDTWEQWCVLSDRPYVKIDLRDGVRTKSTCLLNEANCRQIIENFARSKDNLPATQRHDKGEALAFHDALALVVGGQVVAFAAHDSALSAPAMHQLPGSDRGELPEDGIYCHRCEITHIGLDRVGITLKKISPEVHSNALDPHGESLGYTALGSTYTNYPFLEGNEAQFEESHMATTDTDVSPEEMAQMMQKAGITPQDDTQTAMMKMCRMQKMEKGETQAPAEVPGQPAAKPPAGPPVQMEGVEAQVRPETPPAQAAGAPAPSGGAPTVEPSGKKPEGEQVAMERISRLERLVATQGQELQQFRSREQRRAQSEAQSEARAFAFERGAMGCIEVRRNETEEQALDRIAGLYSKAGKAVAEAALSDPGAHRAIGHGPMLHEFTRSGVPIGWQEPSAKLRAGERPDQALVRLAREKQAKDKTLGQAFAFEKALEQVQSENPELMDAYRDPVRCGLFPVGFQA